MSASAILKLRQQKYYTCFAQAELENVLGHKELSQSAKLLWVALNNQTKGNADLKITHTLAQMGKLIARKVRCVQGLVNELKEFGYLKLVESKNAEGVLTYQIDLPQSALNDVSQSLNRGEAANTPTQFFAPTPAETCVPPTQKSAPLYNKFNNKNNHMSATHKCEEETSRHSVLDTESLQSREGHEQNSKLKQKYEALIAKHNHLLHEKYKSIPIMQRLGKVRAEFTDEERKLMDAFQAVDVVCHSARLSSEANSDSCVAKGDDAESQQLREGQEQAHRDPGYFYAKNSGVTSSVQIQIQGETFSVEPEVKKLVCTQIPKLVATGQFTGRAGNLSATELQREALFYATKAGSKSNKVIDQRHRFFTFCKLCKDGVWEQPKGMVNREIIQREQKWEQQKAQEKRHAQQIMGQLQSMPKASTVAAVIC